MQKILKIDGPVFSVGMKALEKSTGNSGVDVKLTADIREKGHKIMRALGLDVSDTTGEELYHSLLAAAKNTSIEDLLIETDYVLYMIDDTTISFNMVDIIENSHHEIPYGRHSTAHGQRSLRGEIIRRYIKHARTDEKSTREIAAVIGLMPASDAWYNNAKDYKKQAKK